MTKNRPTADFRLAFAQIKSFEVTFCFFFPTIAQLLAKCRQKISLPICMLYLLLPAAAIDVRTS